MEITITQKLEKPYMCNRGHVTITLPADEYEEFVDVFLKGALSCKDEKVPVQYWINKLQGYSEKESV